MTTQQKHDLPEIDRLVIAVAFAREYQTRVKAARELHKAGITREEAGEEYRRIDRMLRQMFPEWNNLKRGLLYYDADGNEMELIYG